MKDKDIDIIRENENEDSLVFPLNVYDSVTSRGSMSKSEKNGILFSFWVAGSLAAGWLLAGILRGVFPNHYLLATVVIELVVQFFAGSFVLRLLVDEETLQAEVNKTDTNFARFFDIYHERCTSEGASFPYDMIEFNDGSYGVYIRQLLGYNTNRRSASTYECNLEIMKLLNRSGMCYRTFYTTENFVSGQAARNMVNSLEKITISTLFRTFRDIVHGLLDNAAKRSNVLCVTYVIYAKTRIQKDELLDVVNKFLLATEKAETAYRQTYVMPYEEVVEFFRHYYKLGIIDMGQVRTHSALKNKISCSVKVLKVYGKSGVVLSSPEYKRMKEQILREQGLLSSKEI